MNIPNFLTLLRIGMIPIFVLVFYLDEMDGNRLDWHRQLACLIFTLAALTDLLDGYLARRLNQISKLGEFLDPVADKLMVAVVLVLLVQADPTPLLSLPAAVIIGREITVSALREWMAEFGARGKVAVSLYGKVKTTAQMLALVFLLYQEPLYGLPMYSIGMVLLYIAAALTLASMYQYLLLAWPKLKETATK